MDTVLCAHALLRWPFFRKRGISMSSNTLTASIGAKDIAKTTVLFDGQNRGIKVPETLISCGFLRRISFSGINYGARGGT
jgi:hypothetical protein